MQKFEIKKQIMTITINNKDFQCQVNYVDSLSIMSKLTDQDLEFFHTLKKQTCNQELKASERKINIQFNKKFVKHGTFFGCVVLIDLNDNVTIHYDSFKHHIIDDDPIEIVNESMKHIFKEIEKHRGEQDLKHGTKNHHPFVWLAILGEEVGEANKAALETEFGYPDNDGTFDKYREELIQVASVAVAMIQNIDDNPIKYNRK